MASDRFFFDTAKGSEVEKKKRNLLDDNSGSEDEDGGGAALEPSELKVNEEYARRFEHNKKREERQRLEEKYKSSKKPRKDGANNDDDDEDDSETSSSEDETEDEAGFLATEELDAQISNVLSAIKNKDPRVRDKNFSFFQAGQGEGADETPLQKKKDKPLFLKDYQRERILAGDVGGSDEDEDQGEGAPKKPRTYNEEQAALKKSIISEINKAAEAGSDEGSDAEGEDEDFVKRKHVERPNGPGSSNVRSSHADRLDDLTESDVANANKDPELFLSNFMSSRAWAAADGRNWQAFESDDDADDADHGDRAEEFEQAYNMRFEDPNKSNEVLRSYARDVTDAKSVRRDEATGRKRQRQLEKERKEAEKAERREEKARLRRLKIEEAEDKLKKIRQVAGMTGKELKDEDWVKFLDEEWNDAGWEKEMRKQFGDEYYAEDDQDVGNDDDEGEEEGGQQKRKRPKKPKWDDDIDINDIVPDFKEDEDPNFTHSDDEAAQNVQGGEVGHDHNEEDEDEDEDEEDQEGHRPSKKRKTTKDHKKDRQAAKRASRADRSRIEALVDSRMDLDAGDDPSVEPDSLAAGPSSAKQQRRRAAEREAGLSFRYRETSPQAFGLTANDILLAPSDADLNKFAGLKKLATFRDDEKKRKDKKRLGKKARLREWRRETFGRGFERTGPEWEQQQQQQQQGVADVKGKKPAAPSKNGASSESRDKPSNLDAGAEGTADGDGEAQGAKAKRKRSRGKRGKGREGVAAEAE